MVRQHVPPGVRSACKGGAWLLLLCLALSTLECDLSVLDVFATLRAGGAIVVVDEAQRRDPDAWARLIDTHKVTVLNFLPG